MKLLCHWLILIELAALSSEECLLELPNQRYYEFKCADTNPENFMYDFVHISSNIKNKRFDYSLHILDSRFISIHSFIYLFSNSEAHLTELAIKNSSVEFIAEHAFENLIFMTSLILSDNNLKDLLFVETLPINLQKLDLSTNGFEVITNVFYNLVNLKYLDLSRCKISRIAPNSFSKLSSIFVNVSHNQLISFNAIFRNHAELSLDLSFNNIENVYLNGSEIKLFGFNISNNKIKSINEMLNSRSLSSDFTLDYLDLSFNDLSKETSFNASNKFINNLNLANSKIRDLSYFHVGDVVTLDLSGNIFTNITPFMFGNDIKINNLNLFNVSMSTINENAFSGLGNNPDTSDRAVLNFSSNPISALKNYIFNNTRIEILDGSNCLIHQIDGDAFYGTVLLSLLNLSNNQISYIKKTNFHNLEKVQTIDLSFNNIKKMDNNLFVNCGKLSTLILSHSKIEVIRNHTFNGTYSLKELDLRNNFLNSIDFQTVSLLDRVYLQYNKILQLSFSFSQNLSANVIILTRNKIRLLKNSTARRSFVREIDLSRTSMPNIESGAFRGLSRLEILNLSNNFINKILPGTFVPLKNLIKLDLKGNHIISFSPQSFAFGNQLYSLDITVFISNFLVNTFSTLNFLNNLNIYNSTILTLNRNSFRGLVNLKAINFYHVSVDKIRPGAFNGLDSLKDINCQDLLRNITVLRGGTFEGLQRLEVLNLSKMSISDIEPESFTGLVKLKRLFLNENKIKTIVNKAFVGLDILKTLNLSNNKISKLEPNAFFGLHNLIELSLCNNNLSELSLGTLQNFPYLKVLHLCRNNISRLITGTFSNLKHLIMLDLSNNNITKLKMDNLFSLTYLQHLDLTGNHLIEIKHLELLKSLRQLQSVALNNNRWKCNNLALMLMDFQNYSISWVSEKEMTYTHENIDGIKCIDMCKFFYCVDDYI